MLKLDFSFRIDRLPLEQETAAVTGQRWAETIKDLFQRGGEVAGSVSKHGTILHASCTCFIVFLDTNSKTKLLIISDRACGTLNPNAPC
jgi:hypothetical protein